MKKNVVILGSDSYRGKQAIDFFKRYPNKYNIVGLTTFSNQDDITQFMSQVKDVCPGNVCVSRKEHMDIIEDKVSKETNVMLYPENLHAFIKDSNCDLVVGAIKGLTSVKLTLSVLADYKDIYLLYPDPILFSGKIITKEAENKGIGLSVLTFPMCGIDQLLKSHSAKDIYSISFFTTKIRSKQLDPLKFDRLGGFISAYNATYKIKLINEMYLMNYIYGTPVEKFVFYEGNLRMINVQMLFEDGSNLVNYTGENMDYIYRHYFGIDISHSHEKFTPAEELDLSFKRINTDKEPCTSLGIEALQRGGSLPILYHMTNRIISELWYKNNLNCFDVPKMLSEVVLDKKLFVRNPDLKTIIAIDKKIRERFLEKYSKSKQKE